MVKKRYGERSGVREKERFKKGGLGEYLHMANADEVLDTVLRLHVESLFPFLHLRTHIYSSQWVYICIYVLHTYILCVCVGDREGERERERERGQTC